MAIIRKAGGRKPGDLFLWPANSTPVGALACPVAATNISRAAYPKLFKAIGTTWGAGDGVTTFGMPFCPADDALLASNGNVGTRSNGAIISHTHSASQAPHAHTASMRIEGGAGSTSRFSKQTGGYATDDSSITISAAQPAVTVNAAGGTKNSAAGMRLKLCVQYA